MFQLNPGALDAEMERRRELAVATMNAPHGLIRQQRVSGVVRFRHAVAMLAIGVVTFAS